MVSGFLTQPGKIKVTDETIALAAEILFSWIRQHPLCTAAGLGNFVEVDELAYANHHRQFCSSGLKLDSDRPADKRPVMCCGKQSWWFFLPAVSRRDSLVSRSAMWTFPARCFPVCPPLLLHTQPGVWVSAGVLLPLLVTAGPPLFIITVLRAAPFIALPGSCIFVGFMSTFALLSPLLDFVIIVVVAAARALCLPFLFLLTLLLFLFLLAGGFLWSFQDSFLCARLGLFEFSVLGFLFGRAFVTKKREQSINKIRRWLGRARLKG